MSHFKDNHSPNNTFQFYPHPKIKSSTCFNPLRWEENLDFNHKQVYDKKLIIDFYPHFKFYYNFVEEEFDTESIFTNFTHGKVGFTHFSYAIMELKRPLTLKQFFINQQIDTPVTLKAYHDKTRPSLRHHHETLVGMMSRHGFHPRTKLWYIATYNNLFREHIFSNDGGLSPLISTLNFFIHYPAFSFKSPTFDFDLNSLNSPSVPETFDTLFSQTRFHHNPNQNEINFELYHNFYYKLFTILGNYSPAFSMKTRKVDKLRFKHSRGKSGKYVVEWKYIPRYKRKKTVMRWFIDDIKFQKARTFKQQIYKTLKLLLTSPEDTLVSRNRKYVHKVVYTRYKNTLLRTLKVV